MNQLSSKIQLMPITQDFSFFEFMLKYKDCIDVFDFTQILR
jgi:hypothetical protein